MIDPLLCLARHGYFDDAKARFNTALADYSREERREYYSRLCQAQLIRRSIFAPLPSHTDGPGIVTSVRVEPTNFIEDRLPMYLAQESRQSACDALDLAWGATGAIGDRPAMSVHLDLFEALQKLEAKPVELSGKSLHLAVFLAAVQVWGGLQPIRNVVVTGHFGQAVDDLQAKCELITALPPDLVARTLLVASPDRNSAHKTIGSVAQFEVSTPQEAIQRVFPLPPWHPTASRTCVHIYCGAKRSAPPPRFGNSTKLVAIDVGDHLSRNSLPQVVERIFNTVKFVPSNRYELSIAGPVELSAMLGNELASSPASVCFIDPRINTPWWANSNARFVCENTTLKAGDHNHDHLAWTKNDFVPPGWHRVDVPATVLPTNLTADTLRDAVEAIANACFSAPAGALHLGIDGPLSLCFAVMTVLRNRRRVLFHKWDQTTQTYEPEPVFET